MAAQKVTLASLEQTAQLAAWIAKNIYFLDIILLYGDLGAGKTTLARGIIQALAGYELNVPSPTFTLVQTYELERAPLFHFDLYRLKSPDEIYELGWEDALSGGIALVEWPERLGDQIPTRAKIISLQIDLDTGMRSAFMEGFNDYNA